MVSWWKCHGSLFVLSPMKYLKEELALSREKSSNPSNIVDILKEKSLAEIKTHWLIKQIALKTRTLACQSACR
jgi:hypothetical protein